MMTDRIAIGLAVLACIACLGGCAAGLEKDAGSLASVASAENVKPTSDRVVGIEVKPRTVPGPNEIVCDETILTGTHQQRELCLSRAQRRAERAASQEWLRSGGFGGSPVVVSGRRLRRLR